MSGIERRPLKVAINSALQTARFMRRSSSASALALLAVSAVVLSPQARAVEYFVANQTDLQNAINTANTNNDTAAVIKLTADITVSTALANPTVPMQIDTQGFTLGGISYSHNNDQTMTLSGTIVAAANTRGVAISSSTVRSSIVNNGSITVGPGPNIAGAGLVATDFVNNGTVKGGYDAGAAGSGVSGGRATHITNYGLIEGGDSAAGDGGRGVSLSTPGGGGSLTNYGIVRGGQTSSTSATGAVGVYLVAIGGGTLTNAGTIEGGSNSAGVVVQAPIRRSSTAATFVAASSTVAPLVSVPTPSDRPAPPLWTSNSGPARTSKATLSPAPRGTTSCDWAERTTAASTCPRSARRHSTETSKTSRRPAAAPGR